MVPKPSPASLAYPRLNRASVSIRICSKYHWNNVFETQKTYIAIYFYVFDNSWEAFPDRQWCSNWQQFKIYALVRNFFAYSQWRFLNLARCKYIFFYHGGDFWNYVSGYHIKNVTFIHCCVLSPAQNFLTFFDVLRSSESTNLQRVHKVFE